jgi:hypothetical protein
MAAVACVFRARIERLVIKELIGQARILAVITTIIASAGRRAITFRVRACSSFYRHINPPSNWLILLAEIGHPSASPARSQGARDSHVHISHQTSNLNEQGAFLYREASAMAPSPGLAVWPFVGRAIPLGL